MFQTERDDAVVRAVDPIFEAAMYIAYIVNVLGRGYCATFHVDGRITVQGVGLTPLDFIPVEDGR